MGSLSLTKLEINDFELVLEVKDQESGLHSFIAIHDTTLGPGVGGIRAKTYDTREDALTDVLRLSEGMTYKAALGNTSTGGAKSVIIVDKSKCSKEQFHAMLKSFAEAVDSLKGKYFCAEDVGISTEDVTVINKYTKFVVGREESSGDPSFFTAWGLFSSIKAVCDYKFQSTVKGKSFAIQGLGAVGMKIAELLFWEGAAKIIVCDPDKNKELEAQRRFSAEIVPLNEIFATECDIFVPCAYGGILNATTIEKLQCKAVVGAANNQILDDAAKHELQKTAILYAPDFIVNGGGLINAASEIYEGGYKADRARDVTSNIGSKLTDVIKQADISKEFTGDVAIKLAKQIINQAK